jgi:hypothetical protein|tara:strand:+ start:689 stop:2557 length:1869 start_codon:yes stop_codon:yes gene_type:complete
MAYQINKTDGTIVSTVADGQIDNISTDITLIGKNFSGFGEVLNENFIKILENFANVTAPTAPIKGQIWFDSTESKLKVYSGTAFVPVSSATIANSQPTTLGVGDLWFNDTAKQLYFFDGTSTILLGPAYSDAQGTSGLIVSSILDTLNQTRVITSLYNNGILLGIFAKDSFTPKNAIEGFSGDIGPGFNQGTLSGIKFDVTCTNSEKLANIDSTNYVRKDTANSLTNTLRIESDLGLVVGSASQANLSVDNGNVKLSNAAEDKLLILDVRKGISQEIAVKISPDIRQIDLYEGAPDSIVKTGGSMELAGDLTIRGNLVINDGDLATIRQTELVVEDKYIVLAQTGDSGSNSDEIADGGGLVIKGTTDKAILYSKDGLGATAEYPALASQAFTSSEHINLATGKEFKINGVTVLSGTSLGTGITSIPGVTAFGAQNVVNIGPGLPPVAQLRLENQKISTLDNNDDIQLEAHGSGNIALIGSPKITGLADPTTAQDAATKEYVDDIAQTRSLAFSMDLSDGKPNSYIASEILAKLAPPAEYRSGTFARILVTLLSNSTVNFNLAPEISISTDTFNTPSGTAPAVTAVNGAIASIPAAGITTSRIIKVFQLLSGNWTHVSDEVLP